MGSLSTAATEVVCKSENTRRSGASPAVFVSLCEDKQRGALPSTDSSNGSFSEQAPLVNSTAEAEKQQLEIIDRSPIICDEAQCKTKKQWLKDPTLYKVKAKFSCFSVANFPQFIYRHYMFVCIGCSYLHVYSTSCEHFTILPSSVLNRHNELPEGKVLFLTEHLIGFYISLHIGSQLLLILGQQNFFGSAILTGSSKQNCHSKYICR